MYSNLFKYEIFHISATRNQKSMYKREKTKWISLVIPTDAVYAGINKRGKQNKNTNIYKKILKNIVNVNVVQGNAVIYRICVQDGRRKMDRLADTAWNGRWATPGISCAYQHAYQHISYYEIVIVEVPTKIG